MNSARTVPLFDPGTKLPCWNERMAEGEYAVHYSSFDEASGSGVCTVFRSLAEAEDFAREQVARRSDLRCQIFDHQGFIGKPVRELRGHDYKDNDLSPRFRRWVGSILFFGGVILTAVDWAADFRYSWPAMIGTRIVIPGLILLFTEAMILLHAKQERDNAKVRGNA